MVTLEAEVILSKECYSEEAEHNTTSLKQPNSTTLSQTRQIYKHRAFSLLDTLGTQGHAGRVVTGAGWKRGAGGVLASRAAGPSPPGRESVVTCSCSCNTED